MSFCTAGKIICSHQCLDFQCACDKIVIQRFKQQTIGKKNFGVENNGLIETVEISRKDGPIPLNIAHLTPVYNVPQPHPNFLDEALAKVTIMDIGDSDIDRGLDEMYVRINKSIIYLNIL